MATTLGRRLLRFVYDARATMCSDDGDPTHAFPVLAGSHLSEQELGTPALALTRAICEALALDRAVADEVATLRRNMLREAAAREFSSSAAFIDPCDTFVLRSVPCGACGGAADLDLARDPALQAHRWACATCAAPIDTGDVEARLLACVSAAGRAHATQDLRCCKCGACAKGRLSSNCDRCGSALELTRPAGVTARDLRTLRRVARWQGFDLLDDATSWMLQDLPE
jgi:DNA polymerase epsilon subunit 1